MIASKYAVLCRDIRAGIMSAKILIQCPPDIDEKAQRAVSRPCRRLRIAQEQAKMRLPVRENALRNTQQHEI
jgi:hypothetical protein